MKSDVITFKLLKYRNRGVFLFKNIYVLLYEGWGRDYYLANL